MIGRGQTFLQWIKLTKKKKSPQKSRNTFNLKCEITVPSTTVFSTFDMNLLAKSIDILIGKLDKFESDLLKTNDD